MVQLAHSNGQFNGLPHKDPKIKIRNFIEISETYIPNGVLQDYMKLMFLPYSLLGVARRMLNFEAKKLYDYMVLYGKEFLKLIHPM